MYNKAIFNKFNNSEILYSRPFTNGVLRDSKRQRADVLIRKIHNMKKGRR